MRRDFSGVFFSLLCLSSSPFIFPVVSVSAKDLLHLSWSYGWGRCSIAWGNCAQKQHAACFAFLSLFLSSCILPFSPFSVILTVSACLTSSLLGRTGDQDQSKRRGMGNTLFRRTDNHFLVL